MVQMDYRSMTAAGDVTDEPEQAAYTILTIVDEGTGFPSAVALNHKGVDPYAVRSVTSFLNRLSHRTVRLRTDGERAIVALAERVRRDREHPTYVESSP
eukprot:8271173-Alexandrium_andersonii.AAC.1